MEIEMKVKPYLGKSWLWVRPHAELDLSTAEEFRSALTNALSVTGCRNLWIDLSSVSFIDSTGLGVLLGRFRELQPVGGNMIITKPSEQVYRLLQASGLTRIMEIDLPLSLRYEKEGV